MQLDRLVKKLEGISDASEKGKKVEDLFKTMTNGKELWFEAYANIYSNQGAITKGVNENTLDGLSLQRVEKIIDQLKRKKYKFTPVRRIYIPKSNQKDLKDLPSDILKKTKFVLIDTVDEIFAGGLLDFVPSTYTLEKLFAEEIEKAKSRKKNRTSQSIAAKDNSKKKRPKR